MIPKLVVWSTE